MPLNKTISLQGDSVFGREEVDYAIDDDYVSRRHFQIALMGDEAYLTDLSSRHGTFLNGEKIARSMRLKSGDIIRVGKTTMAFKMEMAQKNSGAHSGLASCDQPAIVSMDDAANHNDHAQLSSEKALQDRPTDIDMGDDAASVPTNGADATIAKKAPASAKVGSTGSDNASLGSRQRRPEMPNPGSAPVDNSGLDIDLPDSEPQYLYDPGDNPLLPDIISTDSLTDCGPAERGSEEDGPVYVDLDAVEPTAAQPVVASKPNPVAKESPKTSNTPSEKLTGEINLDLDLAKELGGWQQYSSGWHEYIWGPSKSPHSLCDALDEVSQMVSLWAVVHFGKLGSSTPWSLSDCQPIWNGIPEPLAKTYGPVVVHYNILRKALKSEVISKLWNSRLLLLIGGENAAAMQQGFRERLWLRPEGSDTTFQEHPLDSSIFWRLWTRQETPTSPVSQPLWEPHISVVLMAGSDAKEIQVLARKRLKLRSIN